jgi:perosamine synthetase
LKALRTVQLAESIVAALREVIRGSTASLHEPWFKGNEWQYVKDCIDTGWVSSVGSYVDRFERDLAAVTGAKHAVVVANGTSGLHVALQVCGIAAGDEVLVPALSFVATANAVCHCGAQPHFVDSDLSSLGVGVAALAAYLREVAIMRAGVCYNVRTERRIAAIVPMHTFGHPVDMPALLELAERYALVVVEDAAESLGSLVGGRHTGTSGKCGVLSFNGNKIITTGGGGAILTDDAETARHAKHLTTTARRPHKWAFLHDEVAYNFRMPNLNAALGCAQLERLADFVAAKRRLTELYARALRDVSNVTLFIERPGTRANYWLQTLLLDRSLAEQRDAVLLATNEAGFMTRPAWELLPSLPMYRDCERMPLPVAEDLTRRIINLPSSAQLATEL